ADQFHAGDISSPARASLELLSLDQRNIRLQVHGKVHGAREATGRRLRIDYQQSQRGSQRERERNYEDRQKAREWVTGQSPERTQKSLNVSGSGTTHTYAYLTAITLGSASPTSP